MKLFSGFRNNTDDVAVLRRELHNVQKLMMSNLPDPDFETNILDENTRLRQEVRDLRDKSASEEVEKLRQELLHAREDGAKFENAEVERLRLELTRLKEEHENSQSDQGPNTIKLLLLKLIGLLLGKVSLRY